MFVDDVKNNIDEYSRVKTGENEQMVSTYYTFSTID
jgi:hypothetical protein